MLFTDHAKRRMAQRAVSSSQVRLVLQHGKKIHRQGLIFHVMRDKDLPDYLAPHRRGRLKRLAVVTSTDPDPVVITVYRSGKALKRIKHKVKTLRRSVSSVSPS